MPRLLDEPLQTPDRIAPVALLGAVPMRLDHDLVVARAEQLTWLRVGSVGWILPAKPIRTYLKTA